MLILGSASKQIQISYPLSLNLSLIDTAIKGIINDSNDDDEECVANINENQLIIPNRYINFDNLLKF